MRGVYIYTEVVKFYFDHAYTLACIPVTVMDFMGITIECEYVMKYIFDQVLGEYTASTANEAALEVVGMWIF